jgi:hypothetical protein
LLALRKHKQKQVTRGIEKIVSGIGKSNVGTMQDARNCPWRVFNWVEQASSLSNPASCRI